MTQPTWKEDERIEKKVKQLMNSVRYEPLNVKTEEKIRTALYEERAHAIEDLLTRIESEIEGKKNLEQRGWEVPLTAPQRAHNDGIDTALSILRSYK